MRFGYSRAQGGLSLHQPAKIDLRNLYLILATRTRRIDKRNDIHHSYQEIRCSGLANDIVAGPWYGTIVPILQSFNAVITLL